MQTDTDYRFPLARRLVMVQLNDVGEVLPVVRVRNANGAMVPENDLKPEELRLTLKANQTLEFTVDVESGIGTEGFLSTEMCDWGPEVYVPITAAFIGDTWPLGQQDYKPINSNPGAKQISQWNYTFAKSSGRWVLKSEAKIGKTVQTSAITVVPNAGGAVACVVLRLAGAAKGTITFNRGFGPKNQKVWGWTDSLPPINSGSNFGAAGALVTAVTRRVPDLAVPDVAGEAKSGLSAALGAVFRQYDANWKAAGAAGIPQESLEPIRQAVFQYAVEQAVGVLKKNAQPVDVK